MISKPAHNRNIATGDTGKNDQDSFSDYDAVYTRMLAWSSDFLAKIAGETKNKTWRAASRAILKARDPKRKLPKVKHSKPKAKKAKKPRKLSANQKIGHDVAKAMYRANLELGLNNAASRWSV